jgi:hypothetical protein
MTGLVTATDQRHGTSYVEDTHKVRTPQHRDFENRSKLHAVDHPEAQESQEFYPTKRFIREMIKCVEKGNYEVLDPQNFKESYEAPMVTNGAKKNKINSTFIQNSAIAGGNEYETLTPSNKHQKINYLLQKSIPLSTSPETMELISENLRKHGKLPKNIKALVEKETARWNSLDIESKTKAMAKFQKEKRNLALVHLDKTMSIESKHSYKGKPTLSKDLTDHASYDLQEERIYDHRGMKPSKGVYKPMSQSTSLNLQRSDHKFANDHETRLPTLKMGSVLKQRRLQSMI